MDDQQIRLHRALARVNWPEDIRKAATGQIGARHYDYAPIYEILSKIKPALAAQGLSLSQSIIREGDLLTCVTYLMHEDGGVINATCPVTLTPGEKAITSQIMGSAITYARRYCLQLLLALEAADNDAQDQTLLHNKKEHEAELKKDADPYQVETDVAAIKACRTRDEINKLLGGWERDRRQAVWPVAGDYLRKFAEEEKRGAAK
jgi:hypothetical protein